MLRLCPIDSAAGEWVHFDRDSRRVGLQQCQLRRSQSKRLERERLVGLFSHHDGPERYKVTDLIEARVLARTACTRRWLHHVNRILHINDDKCFPRKLSFHNRYREIAVHDVRYNPFDLFF